MFEKKEISQLYHVYFSNPETREICFKVFFLYRSDIYQKSKGECFHRNVSLNKQFTFFY